MTHHLPLATFAISALTAVLIAGAFVLRDTPAQAANQQVTIAGSFFEPATRTISPGDSVTWQNTDRIPHTPASDAGVSPAFNTGEISGSGTSAAVTFSQAGSYAYHCNIHPGMLGTIVVQAAAATTPVVPKTGTGLAADEDSGSLFLPLFAAGATLIAASGALAFVSARRR